jgi:hypothetical protein
MKALLKLISTSVRKSYMKIREEAGKLCRQAEVLLTVLTRPTVASLATVPGTLVVNGI